MAMPELSGMSATRALSPRVMAAATAMAIPAEAQEVT
ncbi:hypothetical protein EcE24377A_3273 [Escherichia coli O139:H28 str. E24377A]|uniref:Uncharacterized protein n=1 Tax=Escherichia coli O139:H28 (strain E24377A / ETEC) TaxID=331111 RepID=A7ZR53_ECO24|nr:hypothetical protein EcE24377A_3273 [Escherichia coli O139:H28 str. E24377A]